MLNQEELLLRFAFAAQHEALTLLADEAEERGDQERAVGYRWLAQNKKWPGCRRRFGDEHWWYWGIPDGSRLGWEDAHEVSQKRLGGVKIDASASQDFTSFVQVLRFGALAIGRALRKDAGGSSG